MFGMGGGPIMERSCGMGAGGAGAMRAEQTETDQAEHPGGNYSGIQETARRERHQHGMEGIDRLNLVLGLQAGRQDASGHAAR